MKKALILGIIGASLFAGPLFDAFKEGVYDVQEQFLMWAKMDGFIVLKALNYWGTTPTDDDWTNLWIGWWDGQPKEIDNKVYSGNERLARWAGQRAYTLSLKRAIKENYDLNRKLGNIGVDLKAHGYVAVATVKDYYVKIDDDWCEKFWTYKKYGPDGKISWKAFVLKTIKEAAEEKKTETEKKGN